jgi:putative hemolysin
MASVALLPPVLPSRVPAPSRTIPARRPELGIYPLAEQQIPGWLVRRPPYRARFARTARDLEAAQRLRYRVFNLELGEGLAASRATGRDADVFDATAHHLIVIDERDGIVVGTYRLTTGELASHGSGFYSSREFDLSEVAPEALAEAVELGRACIAAPQRGQHVLELLFEGIGAYLAHNRKRFLFGCTMLPRQVASASSRITAALRAAGHVDPDLAVRPRTAFQAPPDDPAVVVDAAALPALFQRYLWLGARVASEPAFDRDFGTLDYFTWLDTETLASTRPPFVARTAAPAAPRD